MTVTQIPPRVIRCFKPDRHRDPCPNPALTDFGLCMRHLREASEEWAAVVAQTVDHAPGSFYDATAEHRS